MGVVAELAFRAALAVPSRLRLLVLSSRARFALPLSFCGLIKASSTSLAAGPACLVLVPTFDATGAGCVPSVAIVAILAHRARGARSSSYWTGIMQIFADRANLEVRAVVFKPIFPE